MDKVIFNLGSFPVDLKSLLILIPLVLLATFLYRRFLQRLRSAETAKTDIRKISRVGVSWMLLMISMAFLATTDLNPILLTYSLANSVYAITLLQVLGMFGIIGAALLIEWIIESLLKVYVVKDDGDLATQAKEISSVIRPVIYILSFILLIRLFQFDFVLWHKEATADVPAFNLHLTGLLLGLLALLVVRAGVWLATHQVLPRYYKKNDIALGVRFAINRLFSYFIYLIAFLLILENSGFDLVGLWTGAAALLVGIGIGLQQTFNDLLSGIILLFERSVEVGDMVEVDGLVGRVQEINTRTSLIETRDNITIIVPNSKIVGEKAINWSHHDNKARFHVNVGVAYGSPTKQVRELLIAAAKAHPKIMEFPGPFTRFSDFGASSLDFQLYFFSQQYESVEDVKSDLRHEIDEAFRQNNIQIPFPQQDLWLRNPETLQPALAPAPTL